MAKVAIIPARGGSKRIPGKNIKPFCGKPLLAYPIKTASESELFDEIMVSTDDDEIASVAKSYGAAVPFLRRSEVATDYASTAAVIDEVLMQYAKLSMSFDTICCIYPAAVLITKDDLLEAYALLGNKNTDSVMPVVRYPHPPQRGYTIDSNGKRLSALHPKLLASRTQDLEPIYHDAGQFYFILTSAFLDKKALLTENTCPYVLGEFHSQDIDTAEDWHLAEMKYKYRGLLK